MLKTPLAALAAALLTFGGPVHAEAPARIDLLTENFPPYNMAQDGKNYARDEHISGIGADTVREMFKRAGIDYTLTLRFPWDRIYNTTRQQPGYGLFVTARLPAREDQFKWVGPVGPDHWVLLARGDSSISVTSLEEASQYRIGAYTGGAIAEHLQNKGLVPALALNDRNNVAKLVNGDLDLWATSDPVGFYLARQEGASGFRTVLRFGGADLYLALNKETPDEIVQRLQTALDEMRAEGRLEAIRNRYL